MWGVMSGTEAAPVEDTDDKVKEYYAARRDKALATIVLSVDPSLLCLLGTLTIQYLSGENWKNGSRKSRG